MIYQTVGHILVFGQTYSGKTFYTKHLISQLQHKEVHVFTKSPQQWIDFTDNVYDEFDENIKTLNERFYKQAPYIDCPYIIVFDDFNDSINVNTNTSYRELFTRGRHNGIRIINIAHTAKSIGLLARQNSRYAAIMCTTSDPEIRELAGMFMSGNYLMLRNACEDAKKQNQYSAILLDSRSKLIDTDIAPILIENTVEVSQNSSIMQDIGNAQYLGYTPPQTMNIANKSAHNMVDNSTNNFQINNKIKIQQMIEINNAHNDIKRTNQTFNYNFQLKQDTLDVQKIVRKQFLTPEDKDKIVQTINSTLRPEPPVNIYDYEELLPQFMSHYFKESYTPLNKRSKYSSLLSSTGNMILSGTNNPLHLFNDVKGLCNNLYQD